MHKIDQVRSNVLVVRFDDITQGWEQWILLSTDRHIDSVHSDLALQKRHLEQAKERGALIIDAGDIFDAMQGKNDKRASYSELRDKYKATNYFNKIIDDVADFLHPYADNILLIGQGNHESSVLEKNNLDLISALVTHRALGGNVYAGGYGGYVKFNFRRCNHQVSYNLKYMHGWGGGGPVTRGTIDTNRQAVYLPDANIVLNGHTHDGWYMPITRERFNQSGTLSKDLLHFVRTPGYKDDFGDGGSGWAVTSGKPPKPKGCVWVRFYYYDKNIHIQVIPDITA